MIIAFNRFGQNKIQQTFKKKIIKGTPNRI